MSTSYQVFFKKKQENSYFFVYRYTENQHNRQESRKAGKEISIHKEKVGKKALLSYTGRKGKSWYLYSLNKPACKKQLPQRKTDSKAGRENGSGLYKAGNEQGKQGKNTACSGKKLVHIKQAGRKQKRMIIHLATKKPPCLYTRTIYTRIISLLDQ